MKGHVALQVQHSFMIDATRSNMTVVLLHSTGTRTLALDATRSVGSKVASQYDTRLTTWTTRRQYTSTAEHDAGAVQVVTFIACCDSKAGAGSEMVQDCRCVHDIIPAPCCSIRVLKTVANR